MPVAVALAVAVLFVGGCTSAHGTSLAGEPSESATEASESPSPSPTPSITPAYPTGASGCHDNSWWKTEESAEWVERAVYTPLDEYGSDGNEVTLVSLPGYNGPLCRKITVQVEFWKLVYGVATDTDGERLSNGTRPAYYFDMRRTKHVELRTDGRVDEKIAAPPSLYAADRSPCVGVLVTVTVGKPLTSRELPKEIAVGGEKDYSGRTTVDFRSKRVADYELSEPSAPQVCSPDGKPTADPADVPAPGSQPTDLYPTDLYPTPDYSFDLDDLIATTSP
ncbi:hypothetical protein ACOT81_14375 [Streptomyces sp. WI04-05B]|uniref:hypothetical protein n=1 Tax=Streptomyces TaxID=1883 RepID=UPI0029BBCD14|nr:MULTISPECIES: hypothetical protein [unclassified Streptomyces]MDX2540430.1 hypothetical protein [Streptomyces sp. WI04-05B]MDX2585137.1 hypothetical protein [Streptomyces sp. WI04-05A]MDX3749407.1 hypothetical protein [Streptomyces sp. AK08-02]